MTKHPHLFLIDLSPTWSSGIAQAIAMESQADPTLTHLEIQKRIFIAGIVATIQAHDRCAPIVVEAPK